jgi:mannan endo-1,6-alpha-mannosidase
MSAAEKKFPDPPKGKPQYLELAQAVFNRMANRANLEERQGVCGGGLRWQVISVKDGYNYKNSISNGCFFQLGARLARYTGNETYAIEGVQSYDWLRSVKLITDDYKVADGVDANFDCAESSMDPNRWSYNVGALMAGSAYMYNFVRIPQSISQ